MDKIIFEKVLEMPPDKRVAFAELLLASIHIEENEIRQSWITEVKKRMWP